jgi:hypothetical protein
VGVNLTSRAILEFSFFSLTTCEKLAGAIQLSKLIDSNKASVRSHSYLPDTLYILKMG